MQLRIGTAEGLIEPGRGTTVPGPIRVFGDAALSAGGRLLWHRGGEWHELGTAPGALCAVDAPGGLLVGTEGAHLLRAGSHGLKKLTAFERVAGRDEWYTPWGEPPETRSLACTTDNVLFANVHVGGIARSADGGRSWTPTIDIETDVHQVRAVPGRPELVIAAAAVGLCISRDAGVTWTIAADGLHATYCRAIAVAGDSVVISASEGNRGRKSAIYRAALDGDPLFERITDWIDGNVDTNTLDAVEDRIVFGTRDGRVIESLDAGASWTVAMSRLAPVTSVTLVPTID